MPHNLSQDTNVKHYITMACITSVPTFTACASARASTSRASARRTASANASGRKAQAQSVSLCKTAAWASSAQLRREARGVAASAARQSFTVMASDGKSMITT